MNPKLVYTIVVATACAVEECVRNALRSNGQKKLQKRVNSSIPAPIKKDLSVADNHISQRQWC